MPACGRVNRLGRLFRPVDISGLVYFRVAFGLVMLAWVAKYWAAGLIDHLYIEPTFHFKYYGFEWVEPLPGDAMYAYFAFLGLCATLMAVGCFYRVAAILFALAFTYLFLIDKALYQNHYYLIVLLGWIMVLLPADRAWSVDAWWRRWEPCRTAPAWSLWLVRFQVGVPYFFGGVAKLNSDWLQGHPMRTALAERSDFPFIGQFLAQEWCLWLFVYGGLLFDLLIVPALLWRRTRPVAFALAVAFHLINATVFNIGVFPWLMIAATVVFFPPDWPRRLARRVEPVGGWGLRSADSPVGMRSAECGMRNAECGVRNAGSGSAETIQATYPLVLIAVGVFVLVQLAAPLRHFFSADNPSWTEEGHYFAWHMMLRGKQCGIRYYATNPDTGKTGTVDLRPYLTTFQAARFGRDPRMVHQLARKIAADLREVGVKNVEVRTLALVSLNGRKPQPMIDPRVDLGREPVTWRRPDWIVPLVEPLREEPWDVPLVDWERHIELGPTLNLQSNARASYPNGPAELPTDDAAAEDSDRGRS
jgi:hypothetical protein